MQFRLAKATVKVVASAFDEATPSTVYRNSTIRTRNQAIGAEPSDFLRVRLLNSPPAPRIVQGENIQTFVTIMTGDGAFKNFRALVSWYYPDNFLSSRVAAAEGIYQKTLEEGEARVFITPRGRTIKSDRYAIIWFQLEETLGFPEVRGTMNVRTIDSLLEPGPEIIFGRPFIRYCQTQGRDYTRITESGQPLWEPQLHAVGT